MAKAKSTSTPDFETALERLEHIVKTLESGDLALDAALELFEEGIKLSRLCHGKLEQAERRVEVLLKSNADSERTTAPFNPDESDD
jgi:exodeoxyribonuclease VII small subunit